VRAVPAAGVLAYRVAFARGGQLLFAVELGVEFELVVRALSDRAQLREQVRVRLGPHDWDITGLAVKADGTRAWVACADGTVREIDVMTGTTLKGWHLGAAATALALSPDEQLLVTGSAGGALCLRRLSDGALLHCLNEAGAVTAVAFAEKAPRLAFGSSAGALTLLRLPDLGIVARERAAGAVRTIYLRADAAQLFWAAEPQSGGEIGWWRTGLPPVRHREPIPVGPLAGSDQWPGLISGGADGSVVGRTEGGPPVTLIRLANPIRDVALSGARWLAIASGGPGNEPSVALLELLYRRQSSQ
jgi:hypothetical protein